MAVSYMNVGKADNGSGGGTVEELREQIIAVALDRAFLLDPLPTDEFAFKRRIDEGRGRLTLIANRSGPYGERDLARCTPPQPARSRTPKTRRMPRVTPSSRSTA